MMANGWKTPEQIQKDYDIEKSAYHNWKTECLASPYRDAIIQPTSKRTYIDENKWQEYIKWKSAKRADSHMDKHMKYIK